MDFLKSLRLLTDESRVRILRLLAQEELSVADLQEILGMNQSTISMQLAPLKQAGLVDVRRSGQKSLYRVTPPADSEAIFGEVLARGGAEIPEAATDDAALALILARRKDRLRSYFDELAGRFGRDYVPGRSWKATAEMLLRLLPPLRVADLGAGEGTFSLLLAQSAERVIAVDNSEKMIAYGREVIARNGVGNVEYRCGDLEALPLADGEVDLALMHQSLHHALHPAVAVAEAFRVLRPGGRILILDLLRHDFEDARELYGDVWLGFTQVEMVGLLERAGFVGVGVSVVDREAEGPRFETLMGVGVKSPHPPTPSPRRRGEGESE